MQVFDSQFISSFQDTPFLLSGLCFLGGMSLYLSTVYWLGRFAFGQGHPLNLRQVSGAWMGRVLAACALMSLGYMTYTGAVFTSPMRVLPEIAVLLVLFALYLLAEKRRFLKRRQILKNRLPGELAKVAGVTLLSLVMLLVAAGLINLLRWLPPYMALPAVAVLFIIPAVALYWRAKERDAGEDLRLYHLLFPILLVCALIMIPEFIQHLQAPPKI